MEPQGLKPALVQFSPTPSLFFLRTGPTLLGARKGRDLGFNTVLGFFSKLSSGAGEQILTRPLGREGHVGRRRKRRGGGLFFLPMEIVKTRATGINLVRIETGLFGSFRGFGQVLIVTHWGGVLGWRVGAWSHEFHMEVVGFYNKWNYTPWN